MRAMLPGGVGIWSYRVLLIAALGVAAILRWRLPAVPLFDGDSMGYILAAISYEAGGPFQSWGSRPFLYPAWVWVWLATTGSFAAVFHAQVASGMLSLLIFERSWQRASGFFALRRETWLQATQLNPVGYKIGLELAVRCGCKRCVEIPFTFSTRHAGESKLTARQQLDYLRQLGGLYWFRFKGRLTIAALLLLSITLAAAVRF